MSAASNSSIPKRWHLSGDLEGRNERGEVSHRASSGYLDRLVPSLVVQRMKEKLERWFGADD